MKWARFFPLILLFSCVDGFISNLLYPAVLPLLYRDFLVLFVYVLFLTQENLVRWMKNFIPRIGKTAGSLALCFLLVSLIQVFNPNLPSLFIGLLGFKVYFFYWPLALLAYAYSTDLDKARKLLWWVVIFSIPINLFGLYQFCMGPDFLVDTFGPGFERATIMAMLEDPSREYEESFLRIIGTFASSGQYSNFLVINCMFCFSLLLSSVKIRERSVAYGLLFLSFCALLATGGRGPALTLACSVLAMLPLCSGILRTSWAFLPAAFGIRFAFRWLGGAVVNRFETLRDIEMVSNRTIETTPLMFQELLAKHPFGIGLGIATTASRHLASGEVSEEIFLVENHPSKLLLETGILGVFFFYLFAAAMIIRWLTHWVPAGRQTRNFLGPLSAYGVTFLALSFIGGGFDSPPQSLFFWVIVGIVTRLSAHTTSL